MAQGRNGEICARATSRPRRAAIANLIVVCAGVIALSACAGMAPAERDLAGIDNIENDPQAARPSAAPAGRAVAALEVDLTNIRERLIGLSPERINALFGTPSLNRAEPPSAIWQYRSAICTIDIFMYDAGGITRVDHVDLRSADGAAINESACFKAHLKQNVTQSRLEK